MIKRFLLFCTFIWFYGASAGAITLESRLVDPEQERRAVALFKTIRCLSCAGETIHDSRGRMAKDFRTVIRDRIAEGDSDEVIRTYFIERYGPSVFIRPPGNEHRLLWMAPLFIVAIGVAVLLCTNYRRNAKKRPHSF